MGKKVKRLILPIDNVVKAAAKMLNIFLFFPAAFGISWPLDKMEFNVRFEFCLRIYNFCAASGSNMHLRPACRSLDRLMSIQSWKYIIVSTGRKPCYQTFYTRSSKHGA